MLLLWRMFFLSIVRLVVIFLLHLLALAIIYIIIQPIVQWYLTKIPSLGVDLYYTATYVAYHMQHFSLPFNSFKDIWFGGYPLFRDIFQLHFYLILPFSKYLGLIEGIQTYVMVSLFLLAVFSYLLFYQLSRNIFLSLVLVVAVLYSPNIYGAATWGGSLPYFATQMFFPLTLLLLARYQIDRQKRWFLAASFFSGLGALGHPLPIYTYIFPAAFLMIFFWLKQGIKYGLFPRIKDFLLFSTITILIALRIFYPIISNTFLGLIHGDIIGVFQVGIGASGPAQTALSPATSGYYQGLAKTLYTDTSNLLFILLVVGILLSIISFFFELVKGTWEDLFSNLKTSFGQILPLLLIVLYIVLHVYANAFGHTLLFQGWYRQFWAFPIALGALVAVIWRVFFMEFNLKVAQSAKAWLVNLSKLGIVLIVSSVLSLFGYIFFSTQVKSTIEKIDAKSEASSAFPEILSIKVDKQSQEKLKSELLPSFINPNDKNKRLYTADATVNIWWNSFYNMPLVRGYIDPPIAASERGGLFWLDIAIANDSLTLDFKVPEDIAYNNSLFLLDWNGIYYFEGGRLSSKGPSPGPSSYLVKNNVFEKIEEVTTYGAVLRYQTASGKPELHLDIPQKLKYFKIKDEYTSPVLTATNAPSVAIFSTLAGYEDFLRMIATQNINSKKLIPINAGKYVDSLSLTELQNFDAVFLYHYDYHSKNKAFDNLYKYVQAGGKVFIDTDSETKDSISSNLPQIFPMDRLTRKGESKEWDISVGSSDILKGVDVSKFGPLIFNDDQWKLSTLTEDGKLKEGSNIVLKHKGLPILVERNIGSGKVIWSGFNFPYHYNQYKSQDEAKLFINILNQFTTTDIKEAIPAEAKWYQPEDVVISTKQKTRGILLKEQGYQGWTAKLISEGNRKLPIYLAGPTYPGFMYVPLPKNVEGPMKLKFNFTGTLLSYVVFAISLITAILLLERILFNGLLFGQRMGNVFARVAKKITFWWEREE